MRERSPPGVGNSSTASDTDSTDGLVSEAADRHNDWPVMGADVDERTDEQTRLALHRFAFQLASLVACSGRFGSPVMASQVLAYARRLVRASCYHCCVHKSDCLSGFVLPCVAVSSWRTGVARAFHCSASGASTQSPSPPLVHLPVYSWRADV